MKSPTAPESARPTSLPDYYADERRAFQRVRARSAARWLSLALAGGVLLFWRARR